MKILTFAVLMFAATASVGRSEPPPDELVNRLTAVIREECPDAEFEVAGNTFTAKHETMMFTLHNKSMTGAISPRTHQKEGPNYKGFLLKVTLEQGRRVNQAVTPQTLRGPYFPTYIDDPPTPDGKNQYWVAFSYGSRLDKKLKTAVEEAISRTNFPTKERAKSDSEEVKAAPAADQ
jgi:hypothetical protein